MQKGLCSGKNAEGKRFQCNLKWKIYRMFMQIKCIGKGEQQEKRCKDVAVEAGKREKKKGGRKGKYTECNGEY